MQNTSVLTKATNSANFKRGENRTGGDWDEEPPHPQRWDRTAKKDLRLFRLDVLFNGHVLELTGFKYIATFLEFNKLSFFITSDDAHAWMPADFLHRYLVGRSEE